MGVEPLILTANPGSSSRKYALYKYGKCLREIVFEHEDNGIVCRTGEKGDLKKTNTTIKHLSESVTLLRDLLGEYSDQISAIGLRVVAPSGYFLEDRLINNHTIEKLQELSKRAPLHVKATMQEAKSLKSKFGEVPIVLVSDSAFHASKPDYAWNYGLPLEDTDTHEIKRFGYHGISVASVVKQLRDYDEIPEKLIVCHLGSGNSVTAVYKGKSLDTTMGYSPLEGLIMATRSGSVDLAAARALQSQLKMDNDQFDEYLNKNSGLLGVSGLSADIRDLLAAEKEGHYRASLALNMYVNRIQYGIGCMSSAMNGVDVLVFTGTVGTRSCAIRHRVAENLGYLGMFVDQVVNRTVEDPSRIQRISPRRRVKPVYVVPTDESLEIAKRAKRLVNI